MLSLRCSEPVVSERARQIRIKPSPSVFIVNSEAVPWFVLMVEDVEKAYITIAKHGEYLCVR